MLEERIIKYYIARTGVNHWINYTKLISKSNSLEERDFIGREQPGFSYDVSAVLIEGHETPLFQLQSSSQSF